MKEVKFKLLARARYWFAGFICLLTLLLYAAAETKNRTTYLTVVAGAVARYETVVTFTLPAHLKGKLYGLRDESGHVLPLQVMGNAATFVLPKLAAGERKSYRIVEPRTNLTSPTVQVTRHQNRLTLTLGSRQVLSFVTEPADQSPTEVKPIFLRAGYIHPVYTPAGHTVTDDYPSDHYHHHGIWFAWTKTEFAGGHPDFWNMGDSTGRVDFEAIESSWSGPVHGGFKSRQRYVALTGSAPTVALNEQWNVRVFNVSRDSKSYYLFDIVATQHAAKSPLVLGEYRYGGMAIRGHRDWKDKSKVTFLTSEGKTRLDGNATRARWCHIGGRVDGQMVGLAVLDHPTNFRAPAPLRIHPDDPYLNYAPTQLGKFAIKPGEKYSLHYRYVVSDGPPDPTELNRLWNDFANPPEVSLTVK